MLQNLKIILPQVVWSLFACISGWQSHQMLSSGRIISGGANALICLGMVVLALNWRRTIYYFAPVPLVWKGSVLVLVVLLTTAFLVAGWHNSLAGA